MPKMKSVSGAKKRFRVTGSGRIKKKSAFHRHLMASKSAKRSRRYRKGAMVHPSDVAQVERLLLL